ncbi:MAG: phosphatidylserine/phosphatidylglycerophosphate/cardiolipin synthase family protein [bacterium]
MKSLFWTLFLLAGAGCAADSTEPAAESEQLDLCEQAAEHRAACTGDYVTPPECDDAARLAAQELLATDCADFGTLEASGKADGALCDWFGALCTPDEPIFSGPSCKTDSDCNEASCIENHCVAGVASLEFQDMLDAYTQTIEVAGAQTELLVTNSATKQLRSDLIQSATHSVHFSAFIIQDDETGREAIREFKSAAERGVQVRVIVDATTQYTFSRYEMLQELAESGVEVLAFNPATEWAGLRLTIDMSVNDRLHEKLLIVDGREVVMGGRNVGDEYLVDGQWRDTDVYVAGKGVEEIQRLYLRDWDRIAAWEMASGCESQADWGFSCPPAPIADEPQYYPELDELGTSRTRAIYSDPYHQETPLGYFTTLALVRGARESIVIANSYFVPPRRLRKHLKDAAARGVDVRVLTNSLESTDAWWMYYASINYYRELIGAGIKIYQYKGTETMHAKSMLIDNKLAVIGSYNLDPRSAVDNSESLLLLRDANAVEQLREAMDTDFAFATQASSDIPLAEMAKARGMRLAEPLL